MTRILGGGRRTGVWNPGKNADSRVGSMILHFQTSPQVMQMLLVQEPHFSYKGLRRCGFKESFMYTKEGDKNLPKELLRRRHPWFKRQRINKSRGWVYKIEKQLVNILLLKHQSTICLVPNKYMYQNLYWFNLKNLHFATLGKDPEKWLTY